MGSTIGTVILVGRSFIHDWSFLKKNISLNNIKFWAERHKKFPFYSSWSGLLTTANLQLPAIMLAYFFSPTIVGFYALGYRAIKMPLSLISEAVGRVFFQRASEEKSNNGNTAAVVEAVYKRLVFMGFFPMLVLTIIGKDLFLFVFGSNWSEAGYYMQFFAPWLFFVFISSPISTIFSVLEKQKIALLLNLLKFTITFFVLIIGGLIGEPRIAIILLSIIGLLIRGSLSFYSLKISDVPLSNGFKYIWNAFTFSIPFIVIITISKLFNLHVLMLLLFGLLGGLVYCFFVAQNDVFIKQFIVDLRKGLLKFVNKGH